jgi:hypothetical protein
MLIMIGRTVDVIRTLMDRFCFDVFAEGLLRLIGSLLLAEGRMHTHPKRYVLCIHSLRFKKQEKGRVQRQQRMIRGRFLLSIFRDEYMIV